MKDAKQFNLPNTIFENANDPNKSPVKPNKD
jgi:hypothetical protein